MEGKTNCLFSGLHRFSIQISPTCPGYFNRYGSHVLGVQQSLLVDVLTFHLAPSVLWKCSKDYIGALLWFGPATMQIQSTLEYGRKISQHLLKMFRHLGRECQKHQLINMTSRSVTRPLYVCLRKRCMMQLGRALWKLKNTVQKA